MGDSSASGGKGKKVVEESEMSKEKEKEVELQLELQLEFVMNVGIVKDCELSMPYRTQLTSDKWNLFLRDSDFEEIFLDFLKEGEDVKEGIPVTVYDKGGHEFEMMLKKFHKSENTYYVLNRGWATFCDQHRLKENDIVALRTFRHAITHNLSFVVTFIKIK